MSKFRIYAFLPSSPKEKFISKRREGVRPTYVAIVPQAIEGDEFLIAQSHPYKNLLDYYRVDLGTSIDPWKRVDPGCLYYDSDYGIVWITLYQSSPQFNQRKASYLRDIRNTSFPNKDGEGR